MVFRLVLLFLFYSITLINIQGSTITFLHGENVEVKIQDPVYPGILDYAPQFVYPTTTVFRLPESQIPFYLLSVNSNQYYFWIKGSAENIQVDLSDPQISSPSIVLISKRKWNSSPLDFDFVALENLNEIDLLYKKSLDSLYEVAKSDEQYREKMDFNVVVWDSRSAKRLYNFAIDMFNYQVDEKWSQYSPGYIQYWQLLYKLYYQFYNTNSLKGHSKEKIKEIIESDFPGPESKILVFHHFFRPGITLNELKENYDFLKEDLNAREKKIAEAFIQRQASQNLSNNFKIDFLFGIDIDAAMLGYFARDTSEKKNVLIFWSVWDQNMATEFNLLSNLKRDFSEYYNFVHIAIDAYEKPEKTKLFIYQNRIGGYHLLPEQTNAYSKSQYKKDLKIRDLPFYVLIDENGNTIETESLRLEVSSRLEEKLKYFSTKK